jgi:sulfonate transport system ATP-binding protein
MLADRVVVLTNGRISLDVDVNVSSPRLRSDERFGALRSRLLRELGIDEVAAGAHAR